jgi:hypothetical protein
MWNEPEPKWRRARKQHQREIADFTVIVDNQYVRRPLHGREYKPTSPAGFSECCFQLWQMPRLTHFVTKNPAAEKL